MRIVVASYFASSVVPLRTKEKSRDGLIKMLNLPPSIRGMIKLNLNDSNKPSIEVYKPSIWLAPRSSTEFSRIFEVYPR